VDDLATIPARNLETVCASELPFPFSMLFLTPKCFTLIKFEQGSGVFQGFVAPVVVDHICIKLGNAIFNYNTEIYILSCFIVHLKKREGYNLICESVIVQII